MSYINDALRKAQSEKDSRYGHYSQIVFAAAPQRSAARKRLFFACSFLAVLIAGAALYFYYGDGPALLLQKAVPVKSIPAKPIPAAPSQITLPAPAQTMLPAPDAGDLYRTALEAQKKGQPAEAERMYRAVLERQPAHSGALNNLGVLYMNQDRRADAVRLFNAAAALKDGNADPYYNLACIHARMNETALSLNYLKTAAAMNPLVKVWAREDKDFRNLNASAEFKKITE